MITFNSISGRSGASRNTFPGVYQRSKHTRLAGAEDEITFKSLVAEVPGWPGSVLNLAEDDESNAEADSSEWQNNEDPEAGENNSNVGTGTTHGDTDTDNDLATDEEIGGNAAAGAGATGGPGGSGTSGSGIGGTTTSSNTGVSGLPAGEGTAGT